MDGPPVLDEAAALAQVQGDRRLLQEVAGLFRDDARVTLERIRRAVEAGDPEALARHAHKLKGSAATLGGSAAAAAARRLERMGRARDLEGARALCDVLAQELVRLTRALWALARRPPPPPRR